MKIIDFAKKGNVVRFFLGKDDLKEWWGDDWDDCPYEHKYGVNKRTMQNAINGTTWKCVAYMPEPPEEVIDGDK